MMGRVDAHGVVVLLIPQTAIVSEPPLMANNMLLRHRPGAAGPLGRQHV
jgi:hypothetical protein